MKRLLSIVAVMLFAGALIAQPQQRREMKSAEDMAKDRAEKMKTELGLTDAQKDKVYDHYLQVSKDMEKKREEMRSDREKMRDEMTKARENENKKMKEILTTEQYEKYVKAQEERMKEFEKRGGEQRRGGSRGGGEKK